MCELYMAHTTIRLCFISLLVKYRYRLCLYLFLNFFELKPISLLLPRSFLDNPSAPSCSPPSNWYVYIIKALLLRTTYRVMGHQKKVNIVKTKKRLVYSYSTKVMTLATPQLTSLLILLLFLKECRVMRRTTSVPASI